MPHRLAPDDIGTVLAELQAGIIPTSIFLNNHIEKKDPFAGMSKEESRTMKRKWRKLKKKFGVKNKSLTHQAATVRFHLRKSN
ncbi:MAG: hypothetical protein CMB77_03625 [Euryarchaeota archaeon]|nr:hypothetical protein [Euryarchaeota archaeon]|tara:strand:- start:21515 stop:21763 length:249 start_codon:yes stop_codon:yes gene_type:complete